MNGYRDGKVTLTCDAPGCHRWAYLGEVVAVQVRSHAPDGFAPMSIDGAWRQAVEAEHHLCVYHGIGEAWTAVTGPVGNSPSSAPRSELVIGYP